jgi:hypothetical protein
MPESKGGSTVGDYVRKQTAAPREQLRQVGSAATNEFRKAASSTRSGLRSLGEATQYAAKYYRSKLSKRGARSR